LLLYNSKSNIKEKFEPICANRVKIYVCGPTVYDDAHLGHARSAIVFDLLRRVLKRVGYQVTFVTNFTDIDDKILDKLKNTNQSLEELTQFYIDRYKESMKSLNILEPDYEPRATKSINMMSKFIEKLQDNGYAYEIDDGIYFDTSKDSMYLSISNKKIDNNSLARVEINTQKKDQKDFALWKFSQDGELSYKTKLKPGRPGWHIECSAMIKEHLAYKDREYQIDIHGGGVDLLFPHHENEACQSRCESGVELAKYWVHNGFVQVESEKMSKSLGNSLFLKDVISQYSGEVIRFYLLCIHYRQHFNFKKDDLLSSKKRLDKIYRLKQRISGHNSSVENKEFKKELLDSLCDDLNISKALSVIDEMVVKANNILDKSPKNREFKRETMANIELISDVLGIGFMDENRYFQLNVTSEDIKKIDTLIEQRLNAKKNREFEIADKIREELRAMGISIQDSPSGTIWEKA
jgi:cysteinyl-tRNA synthetase